MVAKLILVKVSATIRLLKFVKDLMEIVDFSEMKCLKKYNTTYPKITTTYKGYIYLWVKPI
jgi:hypothetical protein